MTDFRPSPHCRELLLQENKVLRGLLEQRLLTEKTSWRRYGLNTCASLAGWPEPGGATAAPDSAGAGGRDQDAAGGAEGKGDGGREVGARRGLRGSKLERARRMAAPQVRTATRGTLSPPGV